MKLLSFRKKNNIPKSSKTVYTSHVIRSVARTKRFSQKTVAEILNGVTQAIRREIALGNRVQLTDFGTFYSILKGPSKVRNIKTREMIDIPAMKLPRFRPGSALKQSVRRKKLLSS
jgi:DNA-binding protein HU-beta